MLLKGNQAVYPTLDFPFDFLLTLPARSVKKAPERCSGGG